jgi:hypothetical protein
MSLEQTEICMSITNCTECNKEVSSEAKACPHCGAVAKKSSVWPYLLLAPLGFFVLMMIFAANDPASNAMTDARKSIDLCWQDQARKSLEPGSARFVASVCEMMEKDYLTKYGRAP